MKAARLLASILALLAASLHAPAFAAAKWLRADTHNFIIYSSGGRDQLLEFANNVERFDAMLRMRNGIAREETPNRLTIYLLAQASDVARIMEDKQRMVAGVYLPRQEGSFAIANRAREFSDYQLSGNEVLFHEYAHHFMHHYFVAPYPAWFVEGFAEFHATTEFKPNGNWVLGTPAYHRAFGLLLARKIPIENLLSGEAVRKSVEETDAFYGRSWLLVHMLAVDPARRGQLDKFLIAIGKGTPHRDAAIEAFGDLAALDKDLDAYLRRPRVSVLRSQQTVAVDGEVRIAELDPVASQLVALNLKRRVASDVTKARDALRELTIQAPASADAWHQLALAELQLGQASEDAAAKSAAASASETAVDRALAQDPNHVRANVLKARLLFAKLQDAKDDTAASWNNARSFLRKANAAANLDPEPLVAWYDSFVAQGREPTKNASAGLELAYRLAPEVADLRAKLAFDLARQGQFDLAIRLVEPLAYDPHDGAPGQELLAQIKAMRESAEKPAAAVEPAKP